MSSGRMGETHAFLRSRYLPKGDLRPITHQLLDGGNLHVRDTEMAEFRACVARDMAQKMLPPVTENHTVVFQMFVDFDGKFPVAFLSREAHVRLGAVMNATMQRFFDDRLGEDLVCVVCVKTGDAPPYGDAGLYKHGVHLHWPQVRVTVDQAYEIRAAFLAALEREDWTPHFGTNAIPWDDAVDQSVYAKGLRVVGAPKAARCTACHNVTAQRQRCAECDGRGHVYDDSVYELGSVVVGTERSEERTTRMRANPRRVVDATTVHCDAGTAATPGYRRFTGCPAVAQKNGKRRLENPQSRITGRFRHDGDVTDPETLRIVRKHLILHSPHYQNTTITVRRDATHDKKTQCLIVTKYRVYLTGEGARYCLNKQAEHRGNQAYMDICKTIGGGHGSVMNCWCTKSDIRPLTGQGCNNYCLAPKTLSKDDNLYLFPASAKGVQGEINALHGMKDALQAKEDARLAQKKERTAS